MRLHTIETAPSMRATGAAFSNRFLRHVLLSLRLVAGADYNRILHELGLERYCRELPPPTSTRTIAATDVARLFQAGYHYLPPPLSLLFFIHMGEQMAQDVWDAPGVQALSAALRRVSPVDQVPAVWHGLGMLARPHSPVEYQIHTDTQHYYLSVEQCSYCEEITDAARPVCLATARFYEVMFQKLIDCSVVVHEVECAATGHGHCTFAVRRDWTN